MRIAIALSISLLAGCVATMTDKAARVQVHSQNSNLLADCKKIGPVSADVTNVAMFPADLEISAKIAAREKAADLGADTLAITNIDVGGATASVQGVALRCN